MLNRGDISMNNINSTIEMLFVYYLFWGLVIYIVVMVLKRLAEISRSLRSIDEKLGEKKPLECSSPAGQNVEGEQ